MDSGVIVSLITGLATIGASWFLSRDKAQASEVSLVKERLKNVEDKLQYCEEERNKIVVQLKESIDRENELSRNNIRLMKRILLSDTDKNKAIKKVSKEYGD